MKQICGILGLCATLMATAPVQARDDVLPGWTRHGSVYDRQPLPQSRPGDCALVCNGDARCQSWVHVRPGLEGPEAMCLLLSTTPTAIRAPGRTTGLAQSIVIQIELAAERPPNVQEIEALRASIRPADRPPLRQ